MSAIARVRAYLEAGERVMGGEWLDGFSTDGPYAELLAPDLREVLELAEQYADLRDS